MRFAVLASMLIAGCAADIAVSDRDDRGRTARDASGSDGSSVDSGASSGDAASIASDGAVMDAGAAAQDASVPDTGAAACHHDPFDPCADPFETAADRNDTWSYATYFNDNSSIGCRVGDDIIAIDRTREGVVCPNEEADWYQVTFVYCDTLTMNLEIRLHPKTMCPVDAMELVFNGHACDGSDPNLRCTMDGVDHVIQLIVPPGRTVGGWYFAVRSPRDDVRFEYDVTMRLQ